MSEWIKSSRSASNGNCVEVKLNDDTVQVRDSKKPLGAWLTFTRDEWNAFVGATKDGEFDV